MEEKAQWYVIHTYSGYDNKVKVNLEKAIENRNLEHVLEEIEVPMEEVVERKNGKEKIVLKKKFPGYVLVKMVMTEDSWYIVRNTRGVTGFVGAKSNDPVPLTDEEVTAAHKAGVGDILIICAYCNYEESELATHEPRLLYMAADGSLSHSSNAIPVQLA